MKTYAISKPKVVYETLNTEVIAIDFNTGSYYTLIHVAKQVWQLIERHVSTDRIVHLLAEHYHRDSASLLADVETFIAQLLEKGLIAETSTEQTNEPISIDFHDLEYAPPQIQEYDEVKNLLLLDPIHEVAEAGWPHKIS